jgi:hypothetical protein
VKVPKPTAFDKKMALGTPKKIAVNPLTGSDMKRKIKEGSSIPKTARNRPTARFSAF